MRFFGFLFLVMLVLAFVGWMRGWVVFESVGAAESSRTRIVVDGDRVGDDARRSAAKVQEVTGDLLARLRSRSSNTDAGEQFGIDATLVAVHEAARSVELRVDDDRFSLEVPSDATVVKNGSPSALDQLVPGKPVYVRVRVDGDKRLVARQLSQ